MADAILTAGKVIPGPADVVSERRKALAEVRRVMRDPAASDADLEDALEALVELAKDKE